MLRCLVTCRSCLGQLCRSSNSVLLQNCQRVGHVTLPRPFSVTASHSSTAPDESSGYSVRQGRSKAVHNLAFLVSPENAFSSSPKLQTPHDIKSYYIAIKTKCLLNELSSAELSAIIQLFGSLSILQEQSNQPRAVEGHSGDAVSLHPLAPILHEHQTVDRRTYWAFVLLVGKDKVARGAPLEDSDNYWLMRAALEDAKRTALENPNGSRLRTCLDRARMHYLRIKSPRDGWFIHHLYLTALLDYGGSATHNEIIIRLGNLLSWKGGLPPSLREILWRIIASSGAGVCNSAKTHFLHILRNKLAKVQDISPKSFGASTEVRIRESSNQLRSYDALAIRDYLVDVMFSFKPGTQPALRYLQEVYSWALFECRAALCAFNDGTFATSEEEDRAAWTNLVLLSLTYTSARKMSASNSVAAVAPEQGIDGGVYSQSQVLGWTVICSLAAISSELHVRSHSTKSAESSAKGIQEMARTLWFLWRKEEAWRAGAVTRSVPLICSTVTTFMTLASVTGDSRLAVSLVRHISDVVIYPARFGAEGLDRSMLQECAVHFGVLVTTWGVGSPPQNTWDGILGALRYAQLIPDGSSPDEIRWTSSVASDTLIRLTRDDSLLAHRLCQSAAEQRLIIEVEATWTVGRALAHDGHVDCAINYLKDERIAAHKASLLLDALLDNAVRCHQDNLRSDLVRSFLNTFIDTPVRPTNNNALEAFIQICLRAGYIDESMKIVQRVCESSSTLLRPQFLSKLVTSLVSHRRSRLVGKMLKDTWGKMPARRGLFLRSLRLQYSQQLLSQKATAREIARSLPFSVYIWPVLRHHVPFHPRLAQLKKIFIALKLSSRLLQADSLDEKTLVRAVLLLVKAGRITAALRLLRKHAPTIPTKAGNIILSASLQPRGSRKQRRQVRHASARLSQLVQERGFIPDRVTLNLLMKALLRWKSITPKMALRTLFDRLTMSGYPLPDNLSDMMFKVNASPTVGQHKPSTVSTSHTIFGTDVSPSSRASLSVNLKAFPKHISFTRHTRPLYRMFIKAFKARGDYEGARQVANVLREVKENVMRESATRDEARRLGRIKARQRKRDGE